MNKIVLISVLIIGFFLSSQVMFADVPPLIGEHTNRQTNKHPGQVKSENLFAPFDACDKKIKDCATWKEKNTILETVSSIKEQYRKNTNDVLLTQYCNQIDKEIQKIEACNPKILSADFNFSPNGGSAPCEITFTNISENADSYEWNFGDGGTSKTKNPKHTYAKAGNYTVTLDIKNAQGKTAKSQKSISIKEATKTVVPEVVTVSGYDIGVSSLSDKMKKEWDGKIALLKQDKNAAYHFVIEGHTCDKGSDEANMQLGEKRATVVKEYLVKNGIPASRIKKIISYGKKNPAIPNATDENSRKQNRRVVIVVEQ